MLTTARTKRPHLRLAVDHRRHAGVRLRRLQCGDARHRRARWESQAVMTPAAGPAEGGAPTPPAAMTPGVGGAVRTAGRGTPAAPTAARGTRAAGAAARTAGRGIRAAPTRVAGTAAGPTVGPGDPHASILRTDEGMGVRRTDALDGPRHPDDPGRCLHASGRARRRCVHVEFPERPASSGTGCHVRLGRRVGGAPMTTPARSGKAGEFDQARLGQTITYKHPEARWPDGQDPRDRSTTPSCGSGARRRTSPGSRPAMSSPPTGWATPLLYEWKSQPVPARTRTTC